MPKPYSIDLRGRVVEEFESGASRREAAERYGLSPSVVVIWVQRFEETGSIAANGLRRALPLIWYRTKGSFAAAHESLAGPPATTHGRPGRGPLIGELRPPNLGLTIPETLLATAER